MSQYTERLPWVLFFVVGGIALSIGLSIALKGILPDALRNGIAFWILMLSQFPLIVYFSRKSSPGTSTTPTFRTHLLTATAGGVVVGLLTILF